VQSKSGPLRGAAFSGCITLTLSFIGSAAYPKGLQCLLEVFTQLEEANNEAFAVMVRAVDWGRVRWELEELSGIALRHVRVDRGYQYELDEARDRATRFGVVDEADGGRRSSAGGQVLDFAAGQCRWRSTGWRLGFELLVGCTRLGNLLGLLDREDVPEVQKHLVWVGRADYYGYASSGARPLSNSFRKHRFERVERLILIVLYESISYRYLTYPQADS
jgi:hypothetical protein